MVHKFSGTPKLLSRMTFEANTKAPEVDTDHVVIYCAYFIQWKSTGQLGTPKVHKL